MVRRGDGRELGGNGIGDVFPALGAFVSAGMILGLAASSIALILGGAKGRSPLAQEALGAALGAILGLFMGLSRGVWHHGQPLAGCDPESSPMLLWDPWLDSDRDLEEMMLASEQTATEREEPPAQIETVRAFPAEQVLIRPRVISPETGEAIPLADEVGRLMQDSRSGLVGLVGEPGSGKTMALRHLAAVLPP
jgi:hypothetical protein